MDKRLRHLPLLRCFEAAARAGSYSRAADELAITQAAVSQQIRNLEEALGCKLFYREGRSMKLTKAGAILSMHTVEAFKTLSSGFDRLCAEPLDGTLTVTTAQSFSSLWLVPRLWKFSIEHPNIKVRIIASTQFEDLKHSDIDLAIRQADDVKTDVYQELLLVDQVYPVCSPQLVEDVDLTYPEQILQCWLVEAIDRDRFSWQYWFDAADINVDAEKLNWIEVTTWEMAINAVMAGHGMCIAAGCMTQDWIDKGLLVKPFDINIEPGVKYTLLYDQESPRLERIRAFAGWLKQEIKETTQNYHNSSAE